MRPSPFPHPFGNHTEAATRHIFSLPSSHATCFILAPEHSFVSPITRLVRAVQVDIEGPYTIVYAEIYTLGSWALFETVAEKNMRRS